MRQKKSSKKKILVITSIAIVLLVVAAGVVWARYNNSNSVSPEATNTINYGPPTKQEQTAGDATKEEIVKSEQATNNQGSQSQNTTATTNVIIVDASQYGDDIEVRSFAEGLYTNATCTIRFTRSSESVEKQTPAFADASTTICTNPEISRSEFSSAGEWQVVVSFTANGVSGKSNAQNIIIK